jgi:hypothetical protein
MGGSQAASTRKRITVKKTRRRKYPFVECDLPGHTPSLPGYVICNHVKDQNQPVYEIIPASDVDLGQILCKDGVHASADEAALVCAYCAKERGWLPNLNPGPPT